MIPALVSRGLTLRAARALAEWFGEDALVDDFIRKVPPTGWETTVLAMPGSGAKTRGLILDYFDARLHELREGPVDPPASDRDLLGECLLVLNTIPRRRVHGLSFGDTHDLAAAVARRLAETAP